MEFTSGHLKLLAFTTLTVCSLATSAEAVEQAAVASYLSQFKNTATTRSETLAIMGGEDGASGGAYSFNDKNTDLSVNKAGGRGTIGAPNKLGDTGFTWLPLLGGAIGYIEADNKFKSNPLLFGNVEEFSSFAMGFEAGARINFTKELSVGPMIGVIYSHANSKFIPGNALGTRLKLEYSKQLVDWNMDTVTAVPSADIQYERIFDKDWRLTLSSRYSWFNTWDVASSSKLLNGGGNSSNWENKVDLDVRLPLKVFDFPLHTGGFVSVDLLGGDFRTAVNTNAMYTFNGRLVVGDLTGLWKVNWLGIGVSYIKASTFSGFSWGLDARLLF